MKIEIMGDTALVTTPYSAEFVKKIKSIGGARWDGEKKAWKIPSASVDTARAFMMEIYGESDVSEAIKKVDVKIEALETLRSYRGAYSAMGRTIAQAWGRNSGAKIGEGVDFLVGSPKSSGSVKNWNTEISGDSVFVVHNVPEKIAQAFIATKHPDIKAEIMSPIIKVDRKELEAERERLLRRIDEINEILNN